VSPKITIPRLAIPALKIRRGQLLDISIMGIGIVVPPVDISFWPEIQLLPAMTVFDSEWIHDILDEKVGWFGNIAAGVVDAATPTIIEATFKAVEPYLDGLARDYYARRGKEKT